MNDSPTQPSSTPEPIAIVGMSCRYPGARNLTELWELLCNGTDAITEIPAERWDVDAYYDPDPAVPGKMLTRWGGFIDQIDTFDARFFNISPREANHMDPQQRKLLEVSWEALEHAGIAVERIAGTRGGVFIATLGHDYDEYMFDDYENIDAYIGTGNAHCVAANRLSYVFDLHGPSIAIDTACSGSLVAIHMACQSLRNGESSVALAGGVNTILLPKFNIFFSKAGATAPDGRCKTFDDRANGIVRSEGVGVLILKRLSQAIADGDTIQALILGSAINNDGRSNGLMAPNPQAQEALLQEAYRTAGIDPARVQYVEAHGTGTSLGDPIEVQALGNVLGVGRSSADYCAIGSIKSNIGHTEAAAGIAGVLKVVLAMQHRQLPPSLHVQKLNTRIPFAELPIRVQRSLGPWPNSEQPAIAGVSAFGIGGTNAHVVLQEAPVQTTLVHPSLEEASLLTLSAKTPAALQDMVHTFMQFLDDSATPALHDVCYTAALRRTHHDHRLALVARSHNEARQQLATFLAGETRASLSSGRRAWNTAGKMVFVFSGQGSHWAGMGHELLTHNSVFRAAITRCDQAFSAYLNWSIYDMLANDVDETRINAPDVMQPLIFAVQVALAELWHSWGIVPDAVVGQSLGEIAAAHTAGAICLNDAARIVAERSRLMCRVAGQGKTAVVELPFDQAQFMLAGNEDKLAIAGSSSPNTSVISGDPDALQRVLQFVERRNIFCRILPDIDIAFHSPQMDHLKDELVDVLADITPQAADIPVYSTVTTHAHEGTQFDAAYWGRNLRDPFLFTATFQKLLADGYTTFVEISPHPVLVKPMQDGAQHAGCTISAFASLRRNDSCRAQLLNTLGALYVQGFPVQWQACYPTGGTNTALPHYPWQRERFWYTKMYIEPRQIQQNGSPTSTPQRHTLHPLLGPVLRSALPNKQFFWEIDLSSTKPAYLADHRVQDTIVVPGAAYVEMVLTAAEQVFDLQPVTIDHLYLKQALFLAESGARTVQLVMTHQDPTTATFHIFSAQSGAEQPSWILHAEGALSQTSTNVEAMSISQIDSIKQRCTEHIEGTMHYHRMEAYLGLHYGPAFQSVEDIWRRDGEVLCALKLPIDQQRDYDAYHIHPSFLDAAFQVVTATLPMHEGTTTGDHTFLPVKIGQVQVYGKLDQQLWCHVVLRSEVNLHADEHVADIYLLDVDGRVLVEVQELTLHPLSGHESAKPEHSIHGSLYGVEWQHIDQASQRALTGERWLLFGTHNEFCSAVQAALQAQGAHVDCHDSASLHDVSTIASVLAQQPYTHVSCLFTSDTIAPKKDGRFELGVMHEELCLQLMYLSQALAQCAAVYPPQLTIVTRNAQHAMSSDVIVPSRAAVWGMGRVAAREHPELRLRLIDSDKQASTSIHTLVEELCSTDEPEVALRSGQRYVPRLERLAMRTEPENTAPWRADGSYLITGGLGGLGFTFARWLVMQGVRRLILIGRTPLPPRATWTQPLADSKHAAAVAAVRELELMGASVHVASLDIADEQAVAAFIQTYRAEGWPPIRGVIHAAGVLDDQLLINMDQQALTRVLRAKVHGSWVLHHLLIEEPIEQFVLCSSIAAMFGSIGQANYAAGNAFMDALAHHRHSHGLPALSVNWGPWSDVGMAATDDIADRLAAEGMFSLSPDQGVAALAQLLQHGPIQATVLNTDWARWSSSDSAGLVAELLAAARMGAEDVTPEPRATFVYETLMENPQEEWLPLLEAHVQQLVARVLQIDLSYIDLQQPLNTLGLDSIMALELKTNIEREVGVTVPLVAILQGPSITEFAGRLMPQIQEISNEMEQLLAELEDLSTDEVQGLLETEQMNMEGALA